MCTQWQAPTWVSSPQRWGTFTWTRVSSSLGGGTVGSGPWIIIHLRLSSNSHGRAMYWCCSTCRAALQLCSTATTSMHLTAALRRRFCDSTVEETFRKRHPGHMRWEGRSCDGFCAGPGESLKGMNITQRRFHYLTSCVDHALEGLDTSNCSKTHLEYVHAGSHIPPLFMVT